MNEQYQHEEPRDRTKIIWLTVGVLFIAMVVALWMSGRPKSETSWVRAKHILITYDKNDPADRVRALDLISSLRERLIKGESFSSLAKEYSDDTSSRSRGGVLSDQPRGALAPEFEQYVWNAPLGQLSDIVSTDFGFHLIVVVDRHLSEVDQHEIDLDKRAREEAARQSQTASPAPAPQP
ncbi:MAG TPA: peptidyl-prolyl cis-trans isomerase [Candidatus Hydrogenedentes bacterium]|nr:peptidyl-prolyl cis-trans isomerase [Candidatus Hydrogenedentota bacterium]